jgi:Methyltransferase domain
VSERAYYEAESHWRPELYDSDDERARLKLCGSLVPERAATLLDVGAGQGAFLRWLERNRPRLTLQGIERSEAAVAQSVSETPITLGSIEELPFADRAVDVVTALEVLEHLQWGVFETGVRELSRVAATTIIVSVPYAEKRPMTTCPYCGCRFQPHYHVRSFEPADFALLFDGYALDRQHVATMDDYLAGPALRWAWRRLHGGDHQLQAGALCPQCGFRAEGGASSGAWSAGITARLPRRRRPRWLVGRFVRV